MGITVLSLFDGISCGMVALERAGIEVDKYIAYEIEHNAIEISKKNYPEIVRGGDVTKEDFTKYKGKIDILIGGSPCQNLCSCGNRKGLEGEESRLFFDYVRALYETEEKWFLLENNATMTKENQDIITGIMGVEPIYINSNLLTAQERKRLYWTNIPDIKQPEDKGIFLRDIVQPREEKKEYECYKRMMAKEEGTLAHKKAWSQVKTLDQKSRALTTAQNISNSGATNIKYSDTEYYILTPLECERLQTLPDNYTEGVSNTQRYNLYAESGLMPNNLQNTYNNKLGKTDAEYTAAVDNGSYGNFVKDSAGYGLAQWTYWSRKQALLNHAKQAGVSIADLNMQLGFLWEELQGYTAVMDALKKAGSVRAASDTVLTGYEKPADQSETVKKKRAEYGEGYYKKYAAGNGTKYYRVRKSWTDAASQLGAFTSLENAKSACKAGYTVYDDNGKAVYTTAGQQASAGVPFSVQVDILDLNIRTGAGTNYAKTGETTGKGVFTIVEVKAGQGASAGWGRLKSGAGWISLDYATRLA